LPIQRANAIMKPDWQFLHMGYFLNSTESVDAGKFSPAAWLAGSTIKCYHCQGVWI
jgi:hypothetical protein